MMYRHIKGFEIDGHLEIRIVQSEDEFDEEKQVLQEVLIHGDPIGLKSLANQLIYLAGLDQEKVDEKFDDKCEENSENKLE